MALVITYTTTDNQKLSLSAYKCKTHEFKDNVGYVTLIYPAIKDELFAHQNTLKSVVIPNGVTRIGTYAFSNCSNLESVEIPNSVKTIEGSVFYNCNNLKYIKIPNSVTRIDGWAFYGCTNLKAITIPNSMKCIERYVFYGCTNLSSIKIPNGVTIIEPFAFQKCTNLSSIKIPNSVSCIGYYVFSGCNNLPCNKIDRNKRPILAYKGFGKDMSCRGYKFEIEQNYHEDKVKVCGGGFHACLNPIDVLTYYPNEDGNRFALVELSGDIDFSQLDDSIEDSKVAATDIKIVKELTFEDLINEFNHLNNNENISN